MVGKASTNWMKQLMASTIQNKILLLVLLLSRLTWAQDSLSYLDFLSQVKSSHPLALKAQLINQQADLVVRQARGGFDPVLSSKFKEKEFKDKFYYQAFNADLSIQTISGISLSTGFIQNYGQYLNPENYTPSGGTGYLGASVPLGSGLFFDEARLALRGAQAVQTQLQSEAQLQLNDIYFSASVAYWEWYMAHQVAKNLENSVELAQTRYDFVRQESLLGESSAVDTLKAYLQWRDRKVEQLEAQRFLTSAYFELRKWIWSTTWIDKVNLIPDQKSMLQLSLLEASWSIQNNPKLNQLDAKIIEQQLERRYKIEKLKPKLNFDYSMLYNQVLPNFDGYRNNQIWGLSLQYPLFLRAERAGMKMATIKIQSVELDKQQTFRDLDMKLQNEISQLDLLAVQQKQLTSLVIDYDRLLGFENIKYRMGDSNLFELNAWELKFLEGQNKLIKTETKTAVTYAKLIWYSNLWGNIIK
jgi:outer membrane protein TolC